MLSADIAAFLTAQAIPNVFVEHLPELAGTTVGVYSRAGRAPEIRARLEYPQIQIIVRGSTDSPVAAEDTARLIHDLLHGYAPDAPIAGGVETVLSISATQNPYNIGPDTKGRYEWSINFSLVTDNPNRRIINV